MDSLIKFDFVRDTMDCIQCGYQKFMIFHYSRKEGKGRFGTALRLSGGGGRSAAPALNINNDVGRPLCPALPGEWSGPVFWGKQGPGQETEIR
jgi:hypothetical protein